MVEDAKEELKRIAVRDRSAPEAIEAELAVLYASDAWKDLERVALRYTRSDPHQIQGWLSLAFAMRRTLGVLEAKKILLAVDDRFSATAAILHFNLACYHCLLGEIEHAVARLRRAIKLDPNLRAVAAEDEDLKPLWPMIQELDPSP